MRNLLLLVEMADAEDNFWVEDVPESAIPDLPGFALGHVWDRTQVRNLTLVEVERTVAFWRNPGYVGD